MLTTSTSQPATQVEIPVSRPWDVTGSWE